MSNISEKRTFVPYVHLAKGASTYHLFVVVPTPNDKEVSWDSPLYLNGSTVISGSIITASGGSGDANRLKYYELDPAVAARNGNYSFVASSFEVIVSITGQDNSVHKTTLVYQDADPVAPDSGSISAQLAYNRPYIYLTNPADTAGSSNKEFVPRCLLFVNEYGLHSQKVSILSSNSGVCAQEIILVKDTTVGITEVAASQLDANATQYYENSPIDGYFHIQVLLADNATVGNSLGQSNTAVNEATYAASSAPVSGHTALTKNRSSDSDDSVFI